MGLQQPYRLVDILGRIRPLQKDCIYDYMNLSFGFGTYRQDSCVFLKPKMFQKRKIQKVPLIKDYEFVKMFLLEGEYDD